MNTFWLKILALTAMIIDHTGYVLGANIQRLNLMFGFSYESMDQIFTIMRGIGRLAFPIYAFLVAIGYTHTKDKNKYFINMLLFGIISQIPFTFALSNGYGMTYQEDIFFWYKESFFNIQFILTLIFSIISFICYYKFISNKPKNLIIVSVALLMINIDYLIIGNVAILTGYASVFFTLAMGIYACYCHEKFIGVKVKWVEYLLLIPLIMFPFGIRMDYDWMGVALIYGLFLLRKLRWAQACFVAIWGIYLYDIIMFTPENGLYINYIFGAGILISTIAIILYNGKKGIGLKYFFYTAYPLHLLILGFVSLFFKLSD